MSKELVITGNKVKLGISYATKMFEMEADHLLNISEFETRRLMLQGYSLDDAINIVMNQIDDHDGFAKSFWNRQNKLIRQLENELVAQPVNEWAKINKTEKLRWVLGEVVTHHCHDCKKLSKMEPRTIGEWRELETGLPRDGKTQCSYGCRCMLEPVSSKNKLQYSGDITNVAYKNAWNHYQAWGLNKKYPNLSDQQGAAIHYFTVDDEEILYFNKNAWNNALHADQKQIGNLISDGLNNLPKYNGSIYRGIYLDNISLYKPGNVIQWNGYSSFTYREQYAVNRVINSKRGSGYKVVFKILNGHDGKNIEELSYFGTNIDSPRNEFEVLIDKMSSVKVLDVKKKNGIIYIDLEQIK